MLRDLAEKACRCTKAESELKLMQTSADATKQLLQGQVTMLTHQLSERGNFICRQNEAIAALEWQHGHPEEMQELIVAVTKLMMHYREKDLAVIAAREREIARLQVALTKPPVAQTEPTEQAESSKE